MKYGKLLIIMLAAVWILTSWYSLAFMNSTDASMAGDCPLMSHETMICPMTLAQHIDRWENLFLGISPLLILLVGLLCLNRKSTSHFITLTVRQQRQRWRQRWLTLTPPLASFIYRGLLQPKLYS